MAAPPDNHGLMAYEVRIERAEAQPLAAIRTTSTRPQLSRDIIRLLDRIWPFLREQGVRTRHNVVVYHQGLDIEVGVETFSDFNENGEIRRSATPAGEVITTAHFGDYSAMAPAYAALDQWCRDHDRPPTGVSWEVYGDWEDDAAKRRTDIYFLLAANG
jgi:effector-binding domain-containing protein